MIFKNKSRYKPLYKKFIRLRKNVQNKKKLNLRLLRKKKWRLLNIFLKRQSRKRKKNFRSYNINSFSIRKYGASLRRKFLFNLLNKQRISLFYGSIKNSSLKKLVVSFKFLKKKKLYFIKILERRLAAVLYRSGFTKSFRESRLFINHGHVLVNGKTIFKSNYILKKGDTVKLSCKLHTKIRYNVLSHNVWPYPTNNLIVNFKTFHIIIFNESSINELYNKFPCFLDINNLRNYYYK